MKRKFLVATTILLAFQVSAQTDSKTVPQVKLPAPSTKRIPVSPADLFVTDAFITDASFNTALKNWIFKVNLTVRNGGGLITKSSSIKIFARANSTQRWQEAGSALGILIGLKPQESTTTAVLVNDKLKKLPAAGGFEVMAKLDFGNKIPEANESNNESPVMTVPVRN